MTKSQRVEYWSNIATLLFLTLAIARPQVTWFLWACVALIVIGTLWSLAVSTPADQARRRRSAWLVPVVMALIGAQQVYFASPEERNRAIVLASALVVLGAALGFSRARTK